MALRRDAAKCYGNTPIVRSIGCGVICFGCNSTAISRFGIRSA
jgi:hypothetical protein